MTGGPRAHTHEARGRTAGPRPSVDRVYHGSASGGRRAPRRSGCAVGFMRCPGAGSARAPRPARPRRHGGQRVERHARAGTRDAASSSVQRAACARARGRNGHGFPAECRQADGELSRPQLSGQGRRTPNTYSPQRGPALRTPAVRGRRLGGGGGRATSPFRTRRASCRSCTPCRLWTSHRSEPGLGRQRWRAPGDACGTEPSRDGVTRATGGDGLELWRENT